MHDSLFIRIDKACRSLGTICVCLCFALDTTILLVRESQAECRQFGLARLELGTHLRGFPLALLICFSGAGCFLQSTLSLLECVIIRQASLAEQCCSFFASAAFVGVL
jgi:hypothetical protein